MKEIQTMMSRIGIFLILSCYFTYGSISQAVDRCDGDARVDFTLSISKDSQDLTSLLKSGSLLQDIHGTCVRSIRRVDDALEDDLERFKRILRAEGYYGAAINHRTERSGGDIKILVQVELGERFTVSDITYTSADDTARNLDLSLTAPNLVDILKVGDPARSASIVALEREIQTVFLESGYPDAIVSDRKVTVDHATQLVAVSYEISQGTLRYLGDIQVADGLITKKAYIETLVPWRSGDLYKSSLLRTYHKRLMNTGLFRYATLSPIGAPDETKVTDIALDLEEGPMHRIELGVGYGAGEGFEGELSWTNRNWRGRGETLKFALKMGETEQALTANFKKPHFKKFGQTLSLKGRIGRENIPAYEARLVETQLSLERQMGKRLLGAVGTSIKATEIEENGVTEGFILVGLPMGLTYDGSDSLLDVSSGVRLNVRSQPTYSLKGDRFSFFINEIRASSYLTFGDITFAAKTRVGSIYGGTLDRIPPSERFFSGGGGSVRGFAYQSIGPLNTLGEPIGGKSVAEIAGEVRVRLSEKLSIVPFLDGGMVYDSALPKFKDFRWGAGAGLRYHTGVAPIRFDVAVPLDRRTGEGSVAFYISIGQSF